MSTALTILLLTTAAGEADDAFASAVVRATRQAVGAETQIYVRSLPVLPSNTAAASLGVELHADAVVELTWGAPDEHRAFIHFLRPQSGRWADLEIGFQPADVAAERARTIGFAVASMFPERRSEPLVPLPPKRPEAPVPADVGNASHPARAGVERAGADARAVDAALIMGLGVGDFGGGVGGSLDFRWTFAPALAIRLGGAMRIGEIPPAQVTTRYLGAQAGIAWDGWTARNGRGGVGLRLDGLLVHADFAHLSSDDIATVHQTKWMPGVDLVAEGSWFFAERAAVVAGAGAEAVLGRTEVVVAHRVVTTVAPVRPVLELGLRARF